MSFYVLVQVLLIQSFPGLQLNNKQSEPSQTKSLPKITAQLVFIPGQTNPVLFLNEFEKCRDLKSDKEKMCKIRNFVTDVHRGKNTVSHLIDFVIIIGFL